MTTKQRAAMTAAVEAIRLLQERHQTVTATIVGSDEPWAAMRKRQIEVRELCETEVPAALALLRAALSEPEWQPIEPAPPEGE